MPLDVVISGTSTAYRTITAGAKTYRLQAEEVRVIYQKSSVHLPLVGASPLILDLGQFAPRIEISGKIKDTAQTEGGVTIPSKNLLEDFVEGTFDVDITVTISSDAYASRFAGVSFEYFAARDIFLYFRLSFVITGRT